jgi:transcriptional regulator with XRE-family HTH domain
MTSTDLTLAIALRTARERKKLTQQRAAAAAGVSRGQLAKTESGGNVSVDFLRKIAPVLGLTDIPIGGGVCLVHGTPHDALQLLAALDVMADQVGVMRDLATNFLVANEHGLVDAAAVAAFAAEHGSMNDDDAVRATQATRRLAAEEAVADTAATAADSIVSKRRNQPKRERRRSS